MNETISKNLAGETIVTREDETKTICVLGTVYTIIYDAEPENMPEDCDGCMGYSIKTIKIAKFEQDRNSIKDLDGYTKKLLRHEIIHAFLYESGLWNNTGNVKAWATSEEITDWIAIQFPKMLEAFKQADCVD